MIRFEITGDRFLYKMVRHIVGSIVSVACGHLEVSDIRQALNGGTCKDGKSDNIETQSDTNDFTKRRIFAPARGLFLSDVISFLISCVLLPPKLSVVTAKGSIVRNIVKYMTKERTSHDWCDAW
jgi:hypothetical protein